MIRKPFNYSLALFALILGACGAETTVSGLPAGLEAMESKQVFEPQVTILKDNTIALTWRERGDWIGRRPPRAVTARTRYCCFPANLLLVTPASGSTSSS
jgi:hypothetical protein